jgi:hypothetical protein
MGHSAEGRSLMNAEDDKVVNAAEEMPPEKPTIPLFQTRLGNIARVANFLIATIAVSAVGGIVSNLLAESFSLKIAPEYVRVFALVLSGSIGLGAASYAIIKLYQRQVDERESRATAVWYSERQFFDIVSDDVDALLEEGGRGNAERTE